MIKPKRGALLFAAATLALSGCYRYVPTQLEAMPPGEDVRLTMTRQGAFELAEVIEVTAVAPVVRGQIVRTEDQTLLLSVRVGSRQEGLHSVDLSSTIRIPMGEILGVERREFDAVRSGALAVGTAGVAAAVILVIMESFGNGGRPDGPIDPEETWLPIRLFSIPLGR